MNSSRYLLFPLAACALTAAAQTTGSIQGRVTNSSGSSVEAVSVGLQGQPVGDITDEQGRFQLRRVAPGTYTLIVSAVGLKTSEQQVTVTAGQVATVQVALAESAAELKEVVVSGNRTNRFSRTNSVDVAKMPLKNVENPQVYNTVSKELLTEQLVFTSDQATRNVPGIQQLWEATGRAGDGGTYYTMRGFVTQTQLRNGLAGNVATTIDAVNLDKLEVIKGPSGTLYGNSLTSYGGLLNRVTKRAYDRFGGEASYALGSYNFNRATLDLNLPVGQSHKALFRVNGAWNYEKSFQDVGFSRSYALAPTLTLYPTDKLTITLDGEFQWATATGKQLIFVFSPTSTLGATSADQVPVDYRKAYTGDGLWADSRAVNLFGQVNYQLSPSFRSSSYFGYSHSFSNGFGPYLSLTGNGRGAAQDSLYQQDQSTTNSRGRLLEVQQLFNGDFQLGSLRNRVVLGLDFLHIDNDLHFFGQTYAKVPIRSSYDYSGFNGANMTRLYATAGPSFSFPSIGVRNVYSAFVSDVLNVTERLGLLAAVRVDRFNNQGGLYGGPVEAFNQTAASPKFGAVYQLVPEQLSVFANYQNAFTNRGSYRDYDAATNALTTPINAKLEQANQVEGGVKFDRLGGRFTATLSLYNIHVKNILRTSPDPKGAALYAQTQNGEQVSRGVEVDVIMNPAAGLNVIAGFSYNHSELTNATPDVEGRRPQTAGSPALANLWVSYRLGSGPLKGLGAGVGGNYASDNTILNSTYYGQFVLPSYVVFNASAFYDRPHYRLSVKADNFTNTHYWTGYSSMNPQKLANLVGQVAYKF